MRKSGVEILLLIVSAVLVACTRMDVVPSVGVGQESCTQVVFQAGAATKSAVMSDGRSVEWSVGDKVSLWARGGDGSWTLAGQEFGLIAMDGDKAWFSATLDSAMPEGIYTYYCAYPRPLAVSGTSLTFSLPSVQDGKAGGGADIMVASATEAGALKGLPEPEDHSTMALVFDHLIHLLRFYVPDSHDMFDGEPIQKMVITMPKAVAGSVNVDVTSPGSASLSAGESVITLDLAEPLRASGAEREYAYAAIFPTTFAAGESMTIKVYSETKVGTTAPISLKSRTMAAGHATSVAVVPQSVSSFFRILFHVDSNHLGEDAQKITLTAPAGCRWSDTGSNVYVYEPGHDITSGESFELEFEDESAYRSLSSASVTATYDSEHITISETLTMPDMSSGYGVNMSLNIPYLLFEDFSGLTGFKSNDDWVFSSTGSRDAVSFLGGWTGGRVGGETGQCIRVACRRETSADYHARVDSAPIKGTIKKPVNISVTFDYGANNYFYGPSIITDGNVGQNVYLGYVTDTKAYKSGDTNGTFESDNTFYIKEYTGSYTSTPNDRTMVIHSAPAGNVFRVTWRTEIEHQAGTHSTTAWLYLDNIKVQVTR